MYLDCCNREVASPPEASSSGSELALPTAASAVEITEAIACFSSSRAEEKSYSSDALKQGIWTHHLGRALRGEEPSILTKDGLLTAGSLQNYLQQAVPSTVRDTWTSRRKQTPWLSAGSDQAFVVADLSAVLEKRRTEIASRSNEIRDIVFSHTEHVPIRSLDGFAKPYTVPKLYTSATQSFVVRAAQGNIKDDIEQMHARIQRNLKYPRKDLRVTMPEGSQSGSIWTPDFQYAVWVEQSEDEPSAAVVTRSLSEVRSDGVPNDARFRALFDNLFNTVRLSFAKPVDVLEVIDAIEASGLTEVSVSYPVDCSYCDVSLVGCPGPLRVNDASIELKVSGKPSLQTLLKAFTQMIQAVNRIGVEEHLALPSQRG